MTHLTDYVFYFSICAAFLVNAGFLAAELFGRIKSRDWKKTICAALLPAAVFACGQVFYDGASPRGGYDNDHDFGYLSVDFFQPGLVSLAMSSKEASPLITDALSDVASGFSLRSILLKNRILMFLSSVLLFAALRRLDFGVSAACFGSALFYLNFLAVLNGNAFSTTASNVFFLLSSLYAAIVFETIRRDLKGLLWALAAFFLVWTGRYELAFMPGLMLSVSFLNPGGALRALALRPGARAGVWLFLGVTAVLCAAWTLLVIALSHYNGPPLREAVRLLDHLQYQLGDRNLGMLLPPAAGLAGPLVGCAFAAAFLGAWVSARRAPRLIFWSLLSLWTLFVSSIFMLRDSYPLHFMRHQLYFFIPFVFLFAAAWDACRVFLGTRAAVVRLKWIGLACFCAVYLKANARAVRALEPEKRTNDLEWALLLKASENWPEGCALMYPVRDRQHRYDLLYKYFPLLSADRGGPSPACVIKYLPPIYQIFKDPGLSAPAGYGPAAPSYAPPGSPPLYESFFPHRFYTVTDSETREEAPVRIGFYYADNPKDRAWLLDLEGLRLFKGGGFGAAESRFREAVTLDPACGACGMDLAASLVFGGKNAEAGRLIERELAAGSPGGERPLLSVLLSVNGGHDAAARAALNEFLAGDSGRNYSERGVIYGLALSNRSR